MSSSSSTCVSFPSHPLPSHPHWWPLRARGRSAICAREAKGPHTEKNNMEELTDEDKPANDEDNVIDRLHAEATALDRDY